MITKKTSWQKSVFFLTFILLMAYVIPRHIARAACPFPANTNKTIDSVCTISSTTGIDVASTESSTANTGTVNVSAPTTINNGGTLVTGSLTIGATISIQNGGQIKPGTPLYVSDSTCDGYADNLDTFYTATDSGRRRMFFLKSLTTTKFAGDGHDGPVTISANKNINTDILVPVGNTPVSWWKMDEASGTNVADSFGSNTGTATGTTVITGKYSNARSFNGTSSDYITVTDAASLDPANLTIEAWINPVITGGMDGNMGIIVDKANVATVSNDGYWLGYYDDAAGYYGANSLVLVVATPTGDTTRREYANGVLTENRWYHIAATYDGSDIKFYIDGVLNNGTVYAAGTGNIDGNAINVTLGKPGTVNNSYFKGNIDDVRLYNYARTQAQVQQDMMSAGPGTWRTTADGINYAVSAIGTNTVTLGANPTGYWQMNETSGTSVADSSGNNHTGTATGTTIVAGKYGYGNARSFNGTSDNIGLAGGTNANVTGDISVEAWIKPTTFQAEAVIHKDYQYSFYIYANGTVAWADSSDWSYANFGATNIGLVTGQWQHLAVTKTGGVVKIYLNGVEKASKSFGGALTSTANIMRIGCYAGVSACASSYFLGSIDDVLIYNYARTQSQILKDMYPPGVALAAGDEVMLINLRGDSTNNGNVGAYETKIIQSVSDSVLTFTSNITGTYGVGGNSTLTGQKIMVQRVPNYTNVTINSGQTLTANAFDGTQGGIVAFRANGTVTVTGTISTNRLGYRAGTAGVGKGGTVASAGEAFCGYNSGSGGKSNDTTVDNGAAGSCGGGGGGARGPAGGGTGLIGSGGNAGASGGAGGAGGGAVYPDYTTGVGGGGAGGGYGAGGGGGYAGGTGGNNGTAGGASSGAGAAASQANLSTGGGGGGGGGTYGTANLTKLFLGSGGAGGGGGYDSLSNGTAGGKGGGIVLIHGATVTVTGNVSSNGNNGTNNTSGGTNDGGGGGGGGAGGSIKIISNSITLGTNLVTATAGSAGSASYGGAGGAGGVGRIAVFGSGSGTTNPTFTQL